MGRIKRVNRKISKEKLKLTNLKKEKMDLKDFSLIQDYEFKGPRIFVANPVTPTPLLFTPTKINYKNIYVKDMKTPNSNILKSNIKSVKSKEYDTPDKNRRSQNEESEVKKLIDSNIKKLLSKPMLGNLDDLFLPNYDEQNNNLESPISNKKIEVPVFKPLSPKKNINPLTLQSVPYIPIRKSNCNCKNSKCLKLYCDCFRNQRFCTDLCNCNCCSNKTNNDSRSKAIDIVIKKNPKAFDVKFETNKITVKNKKDLEENVSYRVNFVYMKGCNCKNSQCQKRYCDCFQYGIGCTSKCKCEGCLNGNQIKETKDDQNPNNVIIQQSVIDIKTELKEKLIKIKRTKFNSSVKPSCLKTIAQFEI
jgi:hypothetical protein